MNTEERLRAALEQRAATATRSPDAYAAVRRRGERRRWAYRLQAAGAAAAVLAVVVGAAVALPGGDDRGARPAPPVTTATLPPTEAPTEAPPTGEPSAYASPATPREAAVGPEEYVALLADGRLVIASARDATIRRTVTTFPVRSPLPEPSRWGSPDVDLAPDRAVAYVTLRGTGKCEYDGPIERVDLATGDRRVVAHGDRASISQDGRRLAYVASGCGPGGPGGLAVLDLATGAEQRIRHQHVDERSYPWQLDHAVWHADGRRLWVVVGWESSTELRLLDPATARHTGDATAVPAGDNTTYQLERRGDALLFLDVCCYPELEAPWHLVLREAGGSERRVVTAPAADRLWGAQAGPDGDLLYQRDGSLYRLDLGTGQVTDLGGSTAVARDW